MRVKIDYQRCARPNQCARCLQACPHAVLLMYPEERKDGRRAEGWRVLAMHEALCNGCGLCVSACPRNAIELRG